MGSINITFRQQYETVRYRQRTTVKLIRTAQRITVRQKEALALSVGGVGVGVGVSMPITPTYSNMKFPSLVCCQQAFCSDLEKKFGFFRGGWFKIVPGILEAPSPLHLYNFGLLKNLI